MGWLLPIALVLAVEEPAACPLPVKGAALAVDTAAHRMSGLYPRAQADGSWRVLDVSGRAVAKIARDGALTIEQRSAPMGAARQCPGAGRWPYDCSGPMLSPLGGTTGAGNQSGSATAGALGAALFAGALQAGQQHIKKKAEIRMPAHEVRSRTASFRAQVAEVHYLDQLCDRLAVVHRRILDAWQVPGPTRRRAALFAVWDQTADAFAPVPHFVGPDPLALSRLRDAAIAHARALVTGFIRDRLPPGSAGAYTAAELVRFDHLRTADVRFDPYAVGTTTVTGPAPAPAG